MSYRAHCFVGVMVATALLGALLSWLLFWSTP